MGENITLKGLLLLCRRQLVTILSSFAFIVVLTSILTIYVVPPKYEYSKQIMVGQLDAEKGSDAYKLSADNVQLIRSYMDIINSPAVLESIIKELGLKKSVSSLNDQISLRNNEHSQIVTITVSDSNPALVKKIAELTALHSKEMMKKFTNTNYIQILDQPKYESNPILVFPKPLLITILSAFFGLFTGLCLAILKDGFDTTIKSEKDLEDLLPVPLLGSLHAKEIEQRGKNEDSSGILQKKIQSYASSVKTVASNFSAFFGHFKDVCLKIVKHTSNTTGKNEKDLETVLHIAPLNFSHEKEIQQTEKKRSFSAVIQQAIQSYASFVRTVASNFSASLGRFKDVCLKYTLHTRTKSKKDLETALHISPLDSLYEKEIEHTEKNRYFSQILQQAIQNCASFVRTAVSNLFASLSRFKDFFVNVIKDKLNATIKSEKDLETVLHISSLGSLNEKMIEQMRKNPVGERGDFFGVPQKKIQGYYASVGTD